MPGEPEAMTPEKIVGNLQQTSAADLHAVHETARELREAHQRYADYYKFIEAASGLELARRQAAKAAAN